MIWSIILGIIMCVVLINAGKMPDSLFSNKNSNDYLDSDILWNNSLPKIKDPFFGTMAVSENYFLGQIFFDPIDEEIEISIEKDNCDLPIFEQRNFFRKVESEYDSLIIKIIPLIENEVKNWQSDFKIKDFNIEYSLCWITIPKSDNQEWELAFDSIHDKNHTYTVYFSGFEPQKIMIDG